MDIDALLAEVDGGLDQYIPSKRPAEAPPTAPSPEAAPKAVQPAPPPAEKHEAAGKSPAAPAEKAKPAIALPPGALERVLDIELELTVELGQARVPLKTLMLMQPGEQFMLAERAGELLRIYVNNQLIARGEALVVDGAMAVKIVELLSPAISQESSSCA